MFVTLFCQLLSVSSKLSDGYRCCRQHLERGNSTTEHSLKQNHTFVCVCERCDENYHRVLIHPFLSLEFNNPTTYSATTDSYYSKKKLRTF